MRREDAWGVSSALPPLPSLSRSVTLGRASAAGAAAPDLSWHLLDTLRPLEEPGIVGKLARSLSPTVQDFLSHRRNSRDLRTGRLRTQNQGRSGRAPAVEEDLV